MIEFFLNGAPFTAEVSIQLVMLLLIALMHRAVHRGQYSCVVTNMGGSDIANATVISKHTIIVIWLLFIGV